MIIIGIPSMVRSCLRSREVPQHSLLGSPCRIIESRPRRQWQPANNEHASPVRWCFIRPRFCLLRGGVGRTSQFGGMKLFSVGWLVRWFVETLSAISFGGREVRQSQRCRVVVDLGPGGRQKAQMVGLTSWYISRYYEVNEKFTTAI